VLPQRYGQNDKDWAQHQNEKKEVEVKNKKEEKKGEKEERKRKEKQLENYHITSRLSEEKIVFY
jgi:hypothetical protein